MSLSDVAVESALCRSPTSIGETNILGQTPLHLAAGWPQGVARLLEAGADINAMDKYSLTPLYYACSASCLETLQQLLDAGSVLRSHVDGGHSRLVRLVLESAMHISAYRIGIIEVLIQTLSSRRNQLFELAKDIVAPDRLRGLCIKEDQILDERTSDVYDALACVCPAIPITLCSHSRDLGTVFHMKGLNLEVAEKLFDAGYRDIDGYNSRGLTPLMASRMGPWSWIGEYPVIFSWFISKGASLLTMQRNRSWRTLHFIAADIGDLWRYSFVERPIDEFMDRVSYAMRDAGNLTLSLSDHCSCACSSSGCTMTINIFKESSHGRSLSKNIKHSWNVDARFDHLDIWMSLVVSLGSVPAVSIVTELLRLFLFEELGLTHTCCSYKRCYFKNYSMWTTIEAGFVDGPDAEDRHMIQEEEAEMIRTLETLLELALSRWKNFSGSLSEFVRQFSADELDNCSEDWNEDYAQKVEDIGVKLDRSSLDNDIDHESDISSNEEEENSSC